MDFWKVHILIVTALVALSHLSSQQQTSTKTPEVATLAGDPKSTLTPVPTTTLKQNNNATVNVNDTATQDETVNPTTVAPLTGTTKNDSSSSKETQSPNNLITTTTVGTNEKTPTSTNGTKNDATTLSPQDKTSSATNNDGSTAAPTVNDKTTLNIPSPTKPSSGENKSTPESQTTAGAKTTGSTKNGTDMTMGPTTQKSKATDEKPTTTAAKATGSSENVTNAPTGMVSTENNLPVVTTVKPSTEAPKSTKTVTKSSTNVPPGKVSTKSPNNTSPVVTTQKPSTEAPKSTKTVTKPSTNVPTGKVSTKSPNNTSPVVTTQKPSTDEPKSTKTVTKSSTNVPTGKLSTESPPKTSIVATTLKPSTEAPKSSETVTKSSGSTSALDVTTPKPSTAPKSNQSIYINEIMVDKTGSFQKIELKLSDQTDVTHYTMMIVDGETNTYMAVVNLKDMVQQNGLLLVDFSQSQSSLPTVKDKGTGIAIYDTTQKTLDKQSIWSGDKSGLMDALVIGKNYTMISQKLTQVLTPGVNPFVLDPNIYGLTRTISRCSSKLMRNADMFALTNPSYGLANDVKCKERFDNFKRLAIKISGIDCKLLADSDQPGSSGQLSLQKVMRSVTKEVNKHCRCGLTMMHIVSEDTNIKCCDGVSIDMRFVAATERHMKELSDSYEKFLRDTKVIDIDHKQYTLDSKCEGHCCDGHKVGPKDKSADEKAKNIKVTVAVIVSCLFVFLIVIVIVVIYMKKKNRAVYQFRMSRLDEEDDLYDDGPDHEDFVGGQEATFDTKRR